MMYAQQIAASLRAPLLTAGIIFCASLCGNTLRAEGLLPNTSYKIGWAMDKSKWISFVEAPVYNGALVAIEIINTAGGIDGKVKIDLDARDMKADPMLGGTVVQELIVSGANFIVTTCDTDVSLPGAQAAAAHKLPVMSSCGADAAGPSQVKGEYSFLNVPGTLSQGALLAELAAQRGYKKAYTLKSNSEGYTQTCAKAFELRFADLGGTIVGQSFYDIGDKNFRVTATKIVNSDADVIMSNSFSTDTVAFLKELDRLGNKKPLLLVDGNDAPVIFEAGPQLDLATMTTYGGDQSAGSAFSQFVTEYKKKFGKPSESLQTALGYDLVMVIAAAVKSAGSFDGPAVAAALNNLENVQGATGLISYKNSPVGRGLPKKLYAVTTFDRANHLFNVIELAWPEKIPTLQ